MILRPQTVHERLRLLRETVRNLREVAKVPRAEFVASYRHYWLAERGLQLAAEALFDAGNHILVGHFNVSPTDYEDVVAKLASHGVLSADLAGRLRGLAGFRNLLVHAYLEIDEGRIYDALQGELVSLLGFAAEVEDFLARVARQPLGDAGDPPPR
jgi:uncharacterized protein YutE (UPF0331/DUF86 family)